jgi:hypothetical protein
MLHCCIPIINIEAVGMSKRDKKDGFLPSCIEFVPGRRSSAYLNQLMRKLGLAPNSRGLHLTLLYGKRPERVRAEPKADKLIGGFLNSLTYWTGQDDYIYVVGLMKGDSITAEHNRMVRAGYEHAHSPFRPHVTLASFRYPDPNVLARLDSVNQDLALSPLLLLFVDPTEKFAATAAQK